MESCPWDVAGSRSEMTPCRCGPRVGPNVAGWHRSAPSRSDMPIAAGLVADGVHAPGDDSKGSRALAAKPPMGSGGRSLRPAAIGSPSRKLRSLMSQWLAGLTAGSPRPPACLPCRPGWPRIPQPASWSVASAFRNLREWRASGKCPTRPSGGPMPESHAREKPNKVTPATPCPALLQAKRGASLEVRHRQPTAPPEM